MGGGRKRSVVSTDALPAQDGWDVYMKNTGIEGTRIGRIGVMLIPTVASLSDAELARALDEWLSQSPAGEDHDLAGLDVALTVLDDVREARL